MLLRLPMLLLTALLAACVPPLPKAADTAVDSDADTDADADADADADTDTDTDADTDVDTDTDPKGDGHTTIFGTDLLEIPPGTFEMGREDVGPIHEVTLTRAFWLGRTEITQAEWVAATGTTPWSGADGDALPVNGVTWWDAALYANEVSEAEGVQKCYKSDGTDLDSSLGGDPYACEGYRLPTEAEWEYAARAGEDYQWAGSNDCNEIAWVSENSGGLAHPVATLAPNAWGLHDQSGNVWELTGDWSAPYPEGPVTDPVGTPGEYRIHRGASWYYLCVDSRITNRSEVPPYSANEDRGFRLARTAP